MNELDIKPTWSFSYTDHDGAMTSKIFEADTWTLALYEFVNFLRGCGFIIGEDSIRLNEKHAVGEDWYGDYFSSEDAVEDGLDHNYDALGGWTIPPFEGDPNQCAFKSPFNDKVTIAELLETIEQLRAELDKIKGVQY